MTAYLLEAKLEIKLFLKVICWGKKKKKAVEGKEKDKNCVN